jgi:hypothetical protein
MFVCLFCAPKNVSGTLMEDGGSKSQYLAYACALLVSKST